MARSRTTTPLSVYLNSRRVGTLSKAASGAIDFIYDPDWLSLKSALPVSLSLPLREDRYIGEPVIAVFDNLLPDNADIRKRLAERAKADGADGYSLLAAIGRDCVGALQFVPGDDDPGRAGVVDGRLLSSGEVAGILKGLSENPLGMSDDREFRISLAGAQEKTALLRRDGAWYMPHGATATTHILKPQIGKLKNGIDLSASVENEYLCMKLVRAFGLPVADVEIGDWDGERALIVERFDRVWTKDGKLLRQPQEDCCQALGVVPSLKYESDGGPTILNISALLQGSDTPKKDQEQFLKSQVVFWLLGATDGHAKNFSVHIRPGGGFHLAPLYDIVSLQPAVAANQLRRRDFRLAMAVGNNLHNRVTELVPRYFAETARNCGLRADAFSELARNLAETGAASIDTVLTALPTDFPAAVADPIVDGIRERLAMLGRYDG